MTPKKPTPSRAEWIERYALKFCSFFEDLDEATAREHAESTLESIKEDLTECPEGWAEDDASHCHD